METHQRPLRAFHNSLAIKAEYLARVEAHRQADDLIRGGFGSATGTSGWRGSALGCSFHTADDPHEAAETQIGVLRVLAQLEDWLFGYLSESRFKAWPGQFLQAIPVGADLSKVWPQLAVWLLVDTTQGVIHFAKTESQREAIQHVANLYTKKLTGLEVDHKDWQDAAATATATAAYAAGAAATAAYADAAATVAASIATDAVPVTADDTRYAAYERVADKLLALLASAPVG